MEELAAVDAGSLAVLVTQFPAAPSSRLTQFLKGNDGDVQAAAAALAANAEWRERSLPVPEAEVAEQLGSHKFFRSGVDLGGHPLMVWVGPRHASGQVDATLRMMLFVMEEAIASMGDGVHRWTLMLYAPSGSPFDTDLIRAASTLFSANYPERMAKILIFPTGAMTSFLWGGVQYFLDPVTREKICMMPAAGGRQPPELLEHVAAEELLTSFGGLKVEGGGREANDKAGGAAAEADADAAAAAAADGDPPAAEDGGWLSGIW